jgi:hypothetical protein
MTFMSFVKAATVVAKFFLSVEGVPGTPAREAAPAKVTVEIAMMLMPIHIDVRPPDASIIARAIIIVIIRPIPPWFTVTVVADALATRQRCDDQEAYPQPPSA